MDLFLVEGGTWTLVTRRKPTVSLPCDFIRVGSIIAVRPQAGWQIPDDKPFAAPAARGFLRRDADKESYRWVTSVDGQRHLRRAADAAILIQHEWPSLQHHLGLDDPGPTLAGSLWDLADVLVERDRVRASRSELVRIQPRLPHPSSIADETADLVRKATAKLEHLDGRVAARLADLSRLADEMETFIQQQKTLEQQRKTLDHARSVIRDAGFLDEIGAPAAPADAMEDLAKQTSAVLEAYRELTQ